MKTENDTFKIMAYGKSELAMLYFPKSTPNAALKRLNRWIDKCKPLKKAVAECQIENFPKSFTPRQVELIVEYLGDP